MPRTRTLKELHAILGGEAATITTGDRQRTTAGVVSTGGDLSGTETEYKRWDCSDLDAAVAAAVQALGHVAGPTSGADATTRGKARSLTSELVAFHRECSCGAVSAEGTAWTMVSICPRHRPIFEELV